MKATRDTRLLLTEIRESTCELWNDAFPPGTEVVFRCPMRGEGFSSHTSSKAYVDGSGYPMVDLDGVRGGVLLKFVTPAQPEEPEPT